MKKAMMYLLLALGITLVVIFIGGAMVGFIVGFIDGFYGNEVGTTTSMSVMVYAGSASILLLCIILNWVFLKLGIASYTVGRAPKLVRWKVYVCMAIAFSGIALLSCVIPNSNSGIAQALQAYPWMRSNPLYSIVLIALIEATANLVLYGAVLREILEWKHNPNVVINLFAAIMGLFSCVTTHPSFAPIGFMIAALEGWTYEYSRSVIPIVIGDVAYWIVMLCFMGTTLSAWWLIVVVILLVPGYIALMMLEPTKPID